MAERDGPVTKQAFLNRICMDDMVTELLPCGLGGPVGRQVTQMTTTQGGKHRPGGK